MITKRIKYNPDLGILILRIVLGVAFIAHGYQKFAVMGIDGFAGFLASLGIPMALFFAWVVALAELLGGIGLLLGVKARFAAVLLSVVMIVAIFTAKLPAEGVGFLGAGGYELDVIILGGLLAVLFGGTGKYALMKEEE